MLNLIFFYKIKALIMNIQYPNLVIFVLTNISEYSTIMRDCIRAKKKCPFEALS